MTRTQRTLVVAGAVAAIVIASNASEGAYFSQSWGWVALAFVVGFIVISVMLPILETSTSIQRR